MQQNLILHSGAKAVSYDELRAVPMPEATETHLPVAHHELVELMRYTLGFYGHEIVEEQHAILPDGARYFGLMILHSTYENYTDMLGLRNSHDKSLPIGIAFGSRVFVCDNLAFSASHVIRRKHTMKAKKELPGLMADIVQPLQQERIAQNEKLLRYQATPLSDAQADHAIMSMYRADVIGAKRLIEVVEQWEHPSHDWGGKTAWRLFNAATLALTGRVADKPDRTKRLHEVIDGMVH